MLYLFFDVLLSYAKHMWHGSESCISDELPPTITVTYSALCDCFSAFLRCIPLELSPAKVDGNVSFGLAIRLHFLVAASHTVYTALEPHNQQWYTLITGNHNSSTMLICCNNMRRVINLRPATTSAAYQALLRACESLGGDKAGISLLRCIRIVLSDVRPHVSADAITGTMTTSEPSSASDNSGIMHIGSDTTASSSLLLNLVQDPMLNDDTSYHGRESIDHGPTGSYTAEPMIHTQSGVWLYIERMLLVWLSGANFAVMK